MRRIIKLVHQGDSRYRDRFLLFPKAIGNEWRWLERARWKEVYSFNYADSGWDATEWVDEHNLL